MHCLWTYITNRPECTAACELWFPQSSAVTSTLSSSSSDSSHLQDPAAAATGSTTSTTTAAKPFSSAVECNAACRSDAVPWGWDYVKCLESSRFRVGTKHQLCRAVGSNSSSVTAPQVIHTKVSLCVCIAVHYTDCWHYSSHTWY
jgi:hypothetical protein